MVLIVTEKEVNAIKEYLKQIEQEAMELAESLKLDGQKRWGFQEKFRKAYEAIDAIKPEPEKPKVAKIDVRTGIKRVS